MRNPKKLLKLDNLESHGINVPGTPLSCNDTMKKVFGPAPNNVNLMKFFADPTIEMLWQSHSFWTSNEMSKIVTLFP
jgi:hypothetical protein